MVKWNKGYPLTKWEFTTVRLLFVFQTGLATSCSPAPASSAVTHLIRVHSVQSWGPPGKGQQSDSAALCTFAFPLWPHCNSPGRGQPHFSTQVSTLMRLLSFHPILLHLTFSTSWGLICNDCLWETYLVGHMFLSPLHLEYSILRKFPLEDTMAFIFSDSILLPSTQEDAMVGGCWGPCSLSPCQPRKTAGVETYSFAWNLDSSKLSPKPLTFPHSRLNPSMD